jgi:hypothetical protein
MTNDNLSSNSEQKGEDKPNSVINTVLDQFAITHGIKKIIDKTSWKATDQLNDAIVLFIFLIILFYESQLLRWDLSVASITLYVLVFFIIVEFVGANSPYFKRFFFSEERVEHFIKNLASYKTTDVDKNLSLLTFSPKNINSLLTIIRTDKNKIHPYIIDDILRYTTLSTENLDLIFNFDILELNLRKELVIDLLIKYKNQLSPQNIQNIYTIYKDDEKMIKILIATQIDSQSLLSINSDNPKLKEFFDKYQMDEKKKSKNSKLIARTKIDIISCRIASLLILWLVFIVSIIFAAFYFNIVTSLNMSSVFLISFFGSGILAGIITRTIVDKIVYYWKDNAKNEFLKML